MPPRDESLGQDGHRHPRTHEQQLQEGVPLADLGGANLGAGEAKVPVAGHGLGRRQADPAVVEGGEGEGDVAAEDDDGEPGRDGVLDGERDDGDGHEGLVGHGVDDGADDRLLREPPRDVAVEAVRDGGVGEEAERSHRLRRQDEIADQRRRGEAREGQDVRDGPDVFVGAGEEFRWDGGRVRGWFGGAGVGRSGPVVRVGQPV